MREAVVRAVCLSLLTLGALLVPVRGAQAGRVAISETRLVYPAVATGDDDDPIEANDVVLSAQDGALVLTEAGAGVVLVAGTGCTVAGTTVTCRTANGSAFTGAIIAELFRVVRPGGTVAFTVWTQSGVIGRLLRLAATHDPPPAGVPRPLTWGREERLRQELEIHSPTAQTEPARVRFEFASAEEATDRLLGGIGPLAAMPSDGLREEARAIVADLAGSASGTVRLSAGCLVALGQRPQTSA